MDDLNPRRDALARLFTFEPGEMAEPSGGTGNAFRRSVAFKRSHGCNNARYGAADHRRHELTTRHEIEPTRCGFAFRIRTVKHAIFMYQATSGRER